MKFDKLGQHWRDNNRTGGEAECLKWQRGIVKVRRFETFLRLFCLLMVIPGLYVSVQILHSINDKVELLAFPIVAYVGASAMLLSLVFNIAVPLRTTKTPLVPIDAPLDVCLRAAIEQADEQLSPTASDIRKQAKSLAPFYLGLLLFHLGLVGFTWDMLTGLLVWTAFYVLLLAFFRVNEAIQKYVAKKFVPTYRDRLQAMLDDIDEIESAGEKSKAAK